MPRKTDKKKELTPEEILEQSRVDAFKDYASDYRFKYVSEPTYQFGIGENVLYGAFKSCVVEEILDNGKAYLLRCVSVNNNYGNPYETTCYRIIRWMDARPIKNNDTTFAQNDDLRINFNNSTIKSLMHDYYNFGIDMDPEYQRGYVWDATDKECLIDSIFQNIDIGKFVLVHLNGDEWQKRDVCYEILDGKQRLNALIEFYENRYPYKGKYFNDLSGMDKYRFLNFNIGVGKIRNVDTQTVLKQFLMLNRSGKTIDERHLKKVSDMLKTGL